jgi:hypothetical protein
VKYAKEAEKAASFLRLERRAERLLTVGLRTVPTDLQDLDAGLRTFARGL